MTGCGTSAGSSAPPAAGRRRDPDLYPGRLGQDSRPLGSPGRPPVLDLGRGGAEILQSLALPRPPEQLQAIRCRQVTPHSPGIVNGTPTVPSQPTGSHIISGTWLAPRNGLGGGQAASNSPAPPAPTVTSGLAGNVARLPAAEFDETE